MVRWKVTYVYMLPDEFFGTNKRHISHCKMYVYSANAKDAILFAIEELAKKYECIWCEKDLFLYAKENDLVAVCSKFQVRKAKTDYRFSREIL